MNSYTKEYNNTIPLVVDLDGTLIATDCLWESLLILLKEKPIYLLYLPWWIFKGKFYFKKRVTDCTYLNISVLPYRQHILDYIQVARLNNRQIILATATDMRIAKRIGEYSGIFVDIIATETNNLSGKIKLQKIKELHPLDEFDYIGNSNADLPIWKESRRAIIASSSKSLIDKVRTIHPDVEVLPENSDSRVTTFFKTIRVHQWIKNLLLFVPLFLAHRLSETDTLFKTFIAFISFSLCASSVYILNDLFDLESDRQHPHKKNRPFASGIQQIPTGILLVPLFIIISSIIAWVGVSLDFVFVLWAYLFITTVYSFRLKKVVIVDVLLLAGLYSFRLYAGSVAGSVFLSPWLVAFAIFFFLSLAFVKRYSELLLIFSVNNSQATGRGYYSSDSEIVKTVGMSCGLISVLVFALYMNSREVTKLYHHPQLLWLIGICLLYWIIRVWLIAHRGEMHDDPIIFSIKDKASYLIVVLMIGILILASL
ncbi:MAG: UbiA family prenyltransferase [Bacteroidetes bacterium]|nr:UbiA family prenyltransferase [Bacteroidota bacterium]